MQTLQYRAATARGGVKTLLLSSTILLMLLIGLLLFPEVLSSTAWVLLLICCGLGLFIGYAKLTEPLYVIELSVEGLAYIHHKGYWRIPWQSFSYLAVPEVAGEPLAYIGVKLKDYDGFLHQLQPRLAVHLMVEQRHLLLAALGKNCPSGTCPTDLMIETGQYQTKNRTYNGALAMFARRMQLLRQLTGFDLFIPLSAIGEQPEQFCRKVNQIRLQCIDNTVT